MTGWDAGMSLWADGFAAGMTLAVLLFVAVRFVMLLWSAAGYFREWREDRRVARETRRRVASMPWLGGRAGLVHGSRRLSGWRRR